jgi:hypothetical protein
LRLSQHEIGELWAPRVNQSDGFSPRSETGVSSSPVAGA